MGKNYLEFSIISSSKSFQNAWFLVSHFLVFLVRFLGEKFLVFKFLISRKIIIYYYIFREFQNILTWTSPILLRHIFTCDVFFIIYFLLLLWYNRLFRSGRRRKLTTGSSRNWIRILWRFTLFWRDRWGWSRGCTQLSLRIIIFAKEYIQIFGSDLWRLKFFFFLNLVIFSKNWFLNS